MRSLASDVVRVSASLNSEPASAWSEITELERRVCKYRASAALHLLPLYLDGDDNVEVLGAFKGGDRS
jgi:hypothetical protein